MTARARTYALPPPEFGRDGGEFYKHYDKIADQLDNKMVKGLEANLDGLLIFAGLFASINSGFLALTLTQMSPDPVDDTNALLLQLLDRNGTTPPYLPSKNFSPEPHIPIVNLLLSISLSCALIASFFAVEGKQWLANYQAPDGSGGDKQRGEQLKRSRSAGDWRLVPILDVVIPLLLQIALIIFAAGIALYLVRLDRALGYTIVGLASLAAIFGGCPILVSIWDPYSPYTTPLARFLKWFGPGLTFGIMWVVVAVARWMENLTSVNLASISGERKESQTDVARKLRHGIFPHYREGEILVYFQADFVKRILAISADREAVFHAALNIQLVHDLKAIQRVAHDEAIASRFQDMFLDMERRGVGGRGLQTPSIEAAGDAIAFGGAHLQIELYKDAPVIFDWSPESVFQSAEGLVGVLVNGEGSSNIELPASCRLMRWIFEAWFGTKSLVQQLTLQTSSDLASLPLSLQTAGFIAFAISLSNHLPNTPEPHSFPKWSLESVFPAIQKLFWKRNLDDDLVETVSNALHTFTGHWEQDEKPSHQVYIALLKAITSQLQKADRDDEPYLEGIINKSLIILRSLEGQLRDGAHGLSTFKLRRARALRAAAVGTIEACFARAVFRHRGDYRHDLQYLHRSTMCDALDAMTEYLKFVAESHSRNSPNAVRVNDVANAGIVPLFRPLVRFIQSATTGWSVPNATEEYRLHQTITKEFIPAYEAFARLAGATPINPRALFTEVFHWHEIRSAERRLEVERALERQLRRAMEIDRYEEYWKVASQRAMTL